MDGWAKLGAALGGDQSELAYQQGLSLGAKTQNALAEARKRVDENMFREQSAQDLGDVFAGHMSPTDEALAYSHLGRSGLNLGDILGARGKVQEQGFRATAADPNVPLGIGNRALMGVANGPVEPLKAVGKGGYQNIFEPENGVLPLGDALAGGDESKQVELIKFISGLNKEGWDALAPADKQATALDILRNYGRTFDAGGVEYSTTVNPFRTQQGAAPNANPLTPASSVANNVAEIERAKHVGAGQGDAQTALPDALADIDKLRSNINGLLQKPGFDSIYGSVAGRALPVTGVIDQDVANADAARRQIDAQTFGIAVQKMRGLGQLSNAEGTKVTDAFTRATNPTISPQEARSAWQEVQTYLDAAELRAQRKAQPISPSGGAPAAPGAGQPQTFTTEAEAAAANLTPGTRVIINGVPGTWR